MTRKKLIGEANKRYQCYAIIKEAMGCENREPDYAEIVKFLQRNLKNEALWIVVAGALTGKQSFDCLERALRINPTNKGTFKLMKNANPKRAYKVARELKLFDHLINPQQPHTTDGAQ